jgi:D-arabinose 1-dehydrogenase-like Zn-dependent alcohol dehydrogenase
VSYYKLQDIFVQPYLQILVAVLSHSLKNQDEAKKMGADSFYDTCDKETLKKLKGYFEIIINTVSVELDCPST